MTTSHDHNNYILIVEDDADLRVVEAEVLRAEGYEVREASDGIEALDVLRGSGPPAVIVLDLRMPRLSGWDLAARLRREAAWNEIPLVVVAAHYAIAAEAGSIGARAWLHKPVGIEQFVSVIRRVYEERSNGASP